MNGILCSILAIVLTTLISSGSSTVFKCQRKKKCRRFDGATYAQIDHIVRCCPHGFAIRFFIDEPDLYFESLAAVSEELSFVNNTFVTFDPEEKREIEADGKRSSSEESDEKKKKKKKKKEKKKESSSESKDKSSNSNGSGDKSNSSSGSNETSNSSSGSSGDSSGKRSSNPLQCACVSLEEYGIML